MKRAYQYVEDIKSGKIASGKKMLKTIARFERDLADPRFYLDDEEVKNVLNFIESLEHGFDPMYIGKSSSWKVGRYFI